MKHFIKLLLLLLSFNTLAQAPQGFNYQATVRNQDGQLITNQNVYFKFNIIQGSATAVPIFSETHYVPTDDLGQVSIVIGTGTASVGAFNTINWSLGNYYLGIEINTGNGFIAMGTTQFLSVPFALYAENTGSSTGSLPNGENVGDILVWNGNSWEVSSNQNGGATPTVSTNTGLQYGATEAYSGGTIQSDNGYSITAKGLVWSLDPDPVVSLSTKTNEGPGAQNFNSTMTNLSPISNYYYRAYATNSRGTAYGNTYNFTTEDQLPVVTTFDVTNIGPNSATSGLSISNNGSPILESGIIWQYAYNQNDLTIENYDGINNNGEGNLEMTNLSRGVAYIVRAFAKNSKGYAFGDIKFFTTTTTVPNIDIIFLDVKTTSAIVRIGTANWDYDYIDDGGSQMTSNGVIIGDNENVSLDNSIRTYTNCETGQCSSEWFNAYLYNLLPNTTYYVKGFATNANGTGYTEAGTFTTPAGVPVVYSGRAENVTSNSVTVTGNNILANGGSDVLESGIIVSPNLDSIYEYGNADPNIVTNDGSAMGNFDSTANNLLPAVRYFFSAYAINSYGVGQDLIENYQFYTPSQVGSGVTDIDGNFYQTVIIGNKEWMAEDLKVTRFNDGTPVTEVTQWITWFEYEIPRYYFVEDSYFYNQLVTTNAKQICPSGYRLPTSEDIYPQTPPWNSINDDAYNLNYSGWLSEDGLQDYNNLGHYWFVNSNPRSYRWTDEVLQIDYNQFVIGSCIRCVKE